MLVAWLVAWWTTGATTGVLVTWLVVWWSTGPTTGVLVTWLVAWLLTPGSLTVTDGLIATGSEVRVGAEDTELEEDEGAAVGGAAGEEDEGAAGEAVELEEDEGKVSGAVARPGEVFAGAGPNDV